MEATNYVNEIVRCPICDQPIERVRERLRRLSRMERLQAAADAGVDTWDDYNGVK